MPAVPQGFNELYKRNYAAVYTGYATYICKAFRTLRTAPRTLF